MKVLYVVAYAVGVSIVTILILTLGITYNWPDFVHVNYGVPFVWGTHTLSTIAGPVDQWSVNVWILASDLIVWLGALVVGVAILNRYLRK